MTQGRDVTTAEIAALGNPFPGLRPFEFEESHLFFGRDGQRERLISKLAARRFLAVVGTSGSGKSSLVRAGLLPALFGGVMTGAGSAWRVALLRPGDDPFGNLARALTDPDVFRAESQEGDGVQTAIVEAILRRGCLGLIEAVRQAPLPEGENLLILVDQFEELFRIRHATQVEDYENDRVAFVKLLLEAQRQNEFPIYVALTMRSDYLGDCAQFRDLPEAINESQYLIPRLTRAERREAIAGPVAVFGGKITPRLINRLLNDMGDDPDQLPILQHALMRVWTTWAKDYGPEEPLDLYHYEVIGGWGAALSRHAEEAYDGLGAEGRRQLAAGVFKRLTEKGGDNRETRRPATLAELCAVTGAQEGEVKVVIDAFRRAGRSFLLPPAGKALVAESVIDISHESLIRGWDRLKKWAEEEAQDGEEYRRLAGTAARHREGKAELWRDRELQLALEWRDRLRPTENWARRYAPDFDLAMSFLKQSQDAEEGQRAKEEERRRLAEQDARRRQAEARSKAFRGRVIAILVGLLAAASLFSWYAFSQRRKGQHRLYASNMALALQAKDEWNIPRIKELLDDFSPTQGGKNLRGFVWYHLWLSSRWDVMPLRGHVGAVRALAYSPDGRTLATASDDRTVKLWDIGAEGGRPDTLENQSPGAHLLSLAFSPSGGKRLLAGGSSDGAVHLWGVNEDEREYLRRLDGHERAVNAVAFSPGGVFLATAGDDGTVRVWNAASGREIRRLTGGGGSVTSVAFSPGGETLAAGDEGGKVRIYDVRGWGEWRALGDFSKAVSSVSYSPDGRSLAAGSYDRTVRIWETKGWRELTQEGRELRHTDLVNAVAYSPDGVTLAAAAEDGTVKTWDTRTWEEEATLEAHNSPINAVAYSLGGALTTGSQDKTVVIWRERGSRPDQKILRGHNTTIWSAAYSQDGKYLATASLDKTVKIWEVSAKDWKAGRNVQTLKQDEGKEGHFYAVAYSPDDRFLATGDDDSVKVWNTGTWRAKQLGGLTGTVWSVAYGQGGGLLAAAAGVGAEGSVVVWDTRTWDRAANLKWGGGEAYAVAFSPDGKFLAAAGANNRVKVWDARNWNEVKTLDEGGDKETAKGEDEVRAIAYSHDGKFLAAGIGRTVRLLETGTWKTSKEFEGHQSPILAVSFAPTNKTLGTVSWDGTAKLWDIATGQEVGTLKGLISTLAFHPLPKNRSLAAGGSDGTVRILFGATEEEIAAK